MKKELIILQVDTGSMPPNKAQEYLASVKQMMAEFNNKHSELNYAFLIIPNTIKAVFCGNINTELKIEIKEERVIKEGKVDKNTMSRKSFLYCDDQKIGVLSDESIKTLIDKWKEPFIEKRGDELIITENELSLKTAKYKVDGKWVSYEKLEELEKEKDEEC